MRTQAGIGAVVIALMASAAARGEHGVCDAPGPHCLNKIRPAGGWNPGGGLLHWWDPNCYPRWCGPDD